MVSESISRCICLLRNVSKGPAIISVVELVTGPIIKILLGYLGLHKMGTEWERERGGETRKGREGREMKMNEVTSSHLHIYLLEYSRPTAS